MNTAFERTRFQSGTVIKRLVVVLLLAATCSVGAETVEVDLTVSEITFSPASHPVKALAINGAIPGPVLRFRVGDIARIRVRNDLPRDETSIHWHGLLLPNSEDGVPHLTTPPIPPGGQRVYEFPLRHAGTYWYHSHSGLQEQRGLYGAIVVEPPEGAATPADREHVLVLSDWTDEHPHEVMRTLVRGSDYYAIRKKNMPSIVGAIKAGTLGEYLARERSRMPPMDVSDIAYDAFLINGVREMPLEALPGETVLLRLVNAAASTYFHVESAAGPMTIVAADGPAVVPVPVRRLFIGMGETYDVLIRMPESGAWELRATAQDGSGHAAAWLGKGARHAAADVPRPDLYRMDEMLLAALTESESLGEPDAATVLAAELERPISPYPRLRSATPTAFVETNAVRTIELRLTGDMERYVWSINGRTLAEESTITIRRGEVLRLELINDTMMHHPMHLHGHFFRVLEGYGDHAPLKHTVDVPPMGRRTIEFFADEEKDWLFHCHVLYHMEAGMGRVFSYAEQGPDHRPDLGSHSADHLHFYGETAIRNQMVDGFATLQDARNNYSLLWEVGWGTSSRPYPHGRDPEYEVDLAWSRYLGPNLAPFAAMRFSNEDDTGHRAIAGVDYRLPYLVESRFHVDTRGEVAVRLAKEFQITARLTAFATIEYDTGTRWEWSAGGAWLLNRRFSLIAGHHSEFGPGGGVVFRF